MQFLHGVETVEINSGSRNISVVRSAVIGLIGIGPTGTKNHPVLVTSDREAAEFGLKVPGFSIPQSLDAIFKQGAGTVLVVNIFNESTHTAQVTAEAKTVVDGALKLAYAPIGVVTVLDSEGDPLEAVLNTDYTIDAFGNFKVISSTIANGANLKFTYKRLDASLVQASHFAGSVDGVSGARTGLKCFDLAYNLFGFKPKILIAPLFSHTAAVASELISVAEKFKAITYLDAPFGTTVSGAIAGRGPSGSINFNTSSNRAELLYPGLKWYDDSSNGVAVFAYSAFKAGLRARVDNNLGFWVSDSNHEIRGVVGAEVDISAAINDASTDANRLNEQGITTIFNSYGTGLRSWGNRSASFPTSTAADNFIAVRRTADVINESVELACLQFIDQPITQGWIDSVRESVNAFIRTLIGRGALIDGSCKYIKGDNPKEDLAQGHIKFSIEFMPPTPAERITFNSFININFLSQLQ